ncbi:Nitroreductase-like protein [Trichoderma velutinum]
MSGKISAEQWLAAAKYRRSVYPLRDTSAVSDDRVADIVKEVLSFAPSSYNTQPVRITLVQGEKHKMLWDIAIEEAEPILKGVSEDVWNSMSRQFQAFRGAHGSVIFWEDTETIKEASMAHKSAAHMFGEWSDHANAMHQILIWSALELEGVGANLQHMNTIPPVEAAFKIFLGIPNEYKLKAHLNYGDEAQPHPDIPQKLPLSKSLKIIR